MIGYSQTANATWSHLTDAAQHWDTVADTYEQVWTDAHSRVAGLAWQGQGRDSALAAHTADLTAATTHARAARTAAAAARTGHGNLTAMRDQLVAAADQARGAGYEVSEALTVTPKPGMPPWQQVVMAPDAARRTAELQTRAAALAAYDAEVGAQTTLPAVGAVPRATMMGTGFRTDVPDIAPPDMPDPVPAGGGGNFLPSFRDSLISPPPAPSPRPPMPVMPPTPVTRPPEMRAAPPGPPFDPPNPGSLPAEKNPDPGGVLAGIAGGCAGGAGVAAIITSPIPPAEVVTPEIGCVTGGVMGALGPLTAPWLDNVINGNG